MCVCVCWCLLRRWCMRKLFMRCFVWFHADVLVTRLHSWLVWSIWKMLTWGYASNHLYGHANVRSFKWLRCLTDSNNIHRKFCLVGVWGLDIYMKFLKASLSGYCHWHPPHLSNFPWSTFLFTSCQQTRCHAASFVGSFLFFRSGLMASQDEPDPLLKWLFSV